MREEMQQSSATARWFEVFHIRKFRVTFLASTVILILILLVFARFLTWNELRPGRPQLQDPILLLYSPMDLTWYTFIVIYGGLGIAFIHLLLNPKAFLIAIQAYALIAAFRMFTIFLLPLEAPPGIIEMNDPLVQFFGKGEILLRDLFFSGHTATIFLFYLTAQTKWMRVLFLLSTIFIAVAVLLQHVHYTVDVVAAPFFAYGCYRVAINFSRKLRLID